MDHLKQVAVSFEEALKALVKQEVEEAMKPLLEELALLRRLTDTYVDTATAMKIMGCGRAWLEKERMRPGTLIEVSYLSSKPTYSRASLYKAKDARKPRLHSTNR